MKNIIKVIIISVIMLTNYGCDDDVYVCDDPECDLIMSINEMYLPALGIYDVQVDYKKQCDDRLYHFRKSLEWSFDHHYDPGDCIDLSYFYD